MKYIVYLLFLIVLIGCDNRIKQEKIKNDASVAVSDSSHRMYIIDIDSCEYIIYINDYQSIMSFTHKGNCKYCRERLSIK